MAGTSPNWHDHENPFGYRHEVDPGRVVSGGFAFVGFVVAGVFLLFRSRRIRKLTPVQRMSPQELSAFIVSEAVAEARRDYIERTGANPVPVRTWKREV